MAITNKRKSVTENPSDSRIKDNLKENFKRFINEGADDELPTDELEGDGEEDLDLGGEDLGLGDDLGDEMGEEGMGDEMGDLEGGNSIDNLTDTEAEQVDHWIDELLGDTLEQATVAGGDELDTETMAGDLDPMGEEQFVHDDLPMTTDDVTNIIDSDDSLAALEQELADLAIEHAGEDGEEGGLEGLGGEGTEDGLEDIDGEETEEKENVFEAEDPMKGIDEYFEQGFEGKDIQDGLQEDVELAKDNKDLGMKKVPAGLNDKITNKVSPTPGARTEEEIKNDVYKVVQESTKKSKMIFKAAAIIADMKKSQVKQAKLIESLKLDNYKLIKANGLLSVAGDQLSKEARTQISESFDKCQNIDQVNKFYNKLTEKIKTAARPSLNTTVSNKKTKINVIKESADKKQDAKITHEQERINMLMGLSTDNDVYFQ